MCQPPPEVHCVVGLGDDVDDLRMRRIALDERMSCRALRTSAPNAIWASGRETVLITKHQHVMLDEGVAHHADRLGISRCRQVDSGDLRTERSCEPPDLHGRIIARSAREL